MSTIKAGKPGAVPQVQHVRGVEVKTFVLPRAVVDRIRAVQADKRKEPRK
jgi:hypothetical protein